MPPQATDTADARQTKGFLGFLQTQIGSGQRWIGRSRQWATVRTLGQTSTRRAARRPVWE